MSPAFVLGPLVALGSNTSLYLLATGWVPPLCLRGWLPNLPFYVQPLTTLCRLDRMMLRWHHRLNGHEFEPASGDSGEQRNLAWLQPMRSQSWT